MKKSVYSIVLGGVSLLALSACMQEDAPGNLNRNKILYLRGDGMAIQRYEACPSNTENQTKWHHRHHRHHAAKAKTDAAKADMKKEEAKKEDAKSEKKDSK